MILRLIILVNRDERVMIAESMEYPEKTEQPGHQLREGSTMSGSLVKMLMPLVRSQLPEMLRNTLVI